MKPGAMTAYQFLAWAAVGILLVLCIYELVFLTSYRVRTEEVLLNIGIPFLIAALLSGTVVATGARSMTGRVIFTVLAAIIIVLSLLALIGSLGRTGGTMIFLLSLLELAVLIAAIVCVFQGSVNRWFREKAAGSYAYAGGHGGSYGQLGDPGTSQGNWNQPSQGAWNQPTQPWGGPAAGGGHDTTVAAGTRPCPYCAEQIRAEATKCRFCGSEVQPLVG